MATRVFVAEAMNFRTISYIDDRMQAINCDVPNVSQLKLDIMDEFAMEASIAKVWGSESLFATADDAVQCFGGYGFSSEYPPEKIYRDNRINRIFEGTSEINRLIIASTLFKKASNGSIVLSFNATDGVPKLVDFDGLLARSKHAVELAKRLCRYSVYQAMETCGQKLIENQESSARVADMMIDIYAMECAVVRAGLMTDAGHHWAELARDFADAYVNEIWHKVHTNATMLLADVLSDEKLESALADLGTFSTFIPKSSSKIRDRIAQRIIEVGVYPIAQYSFYFLWYK
jgi:hypothetical protein